jgi:hypothetical protein
VTPFFLAGIERDSDRTEAACSELRERSQILLGCAARPRRIFKLDCRFDGRDAEIEVGRPMPDGGDVVVAALDHRRGEAFVVHTLDGADPPTRVTRPVYAVTDFS